MNNADVAAIIGIDLFQMRAGGKGGGGVCHATNHNPIPASPTTFFHYERRPRRRHRLRRLFFFFSLHSPTTIVWRFLEILGDSWGFFEEAGPDEIIDQRLRNEIINENADKET